MLERLLMIFLLAIMAACSGGGGGSENTATINPLPGTGTTNPGTGTGTGTTTPTPAPSGTLQMLGGTVEVAAGKNAVVQAKVTCPTAAAASTRCTQVLNGVNYTITSNLLSSISVKLNGIVVGTTFAITDAGNLEITGTVPLTATLGQTAQVSLSATATNGTVSVGGTPTTLKVVQEAERVANVTPRLFTRSTTDEIAGFDTRCPANSGGCVIKAMGQSLWAINTAIPKGVRVGTYLGPVFWYELETIALPLVSSPQTFVLDSPFRVAAGQNFRVSVRGNIPSGGFVFTKFEFVSVSDGLPIPILFPESLCESVLHPFVPRGCKA